MIWVRWKDRGSTLTDYFLNQRQDAIEGKPEIKSVRAAVNVHQIAFTQIEIAYQNFPEVFLTQRRQRSNAAALTRPLHAPQRRNCACR